MPGVRLFTSVALARAFQDGLVVEATAFFDSIAFNELWTEVAPAD